MRVLCIDFIDIAHGAGRMVYLYCERQAVRPITDTAARSSRDRASEAIGEGPREIGRAGCPFPSGGVHMTARTPDAEPLLTPAEVATMFRVDPKTVTRWAKAGKLTSIRTLGGHRRYREQEVRALLNGIPPQREG